MDKIDIKSLTYEQLEQQILLLGEKRFRAGQIFSWLHQKLAASFDEMSDLPVSLRKNLTERFEFTLLKTVQVQVSKQDATRKYLFALADGNVIESVWMKYQHGNSVCVSSQVGCRMGCRFCASAIGGLTRNLNASEILEQVYRIQADTKERVSHVVVMGAGEPMDNYDEVVSFIRLLSDERGLHISQRNMTVSTCGIVPGIKRLTEEGLQVTLALSLHAPNDLVRETLMPVAKRYPLSEVLSCVMEYYKRTGRRVTMEYSLVGGMNDSEEEACELGRLLRNFACHVNLIPVNPVTEHGLIQPSRRNVENFKNSPEKYGINVTIRREMGRDIDGACGQLRKNFLENLHTGG